MVPMNPEEQRAIQHLMARGRDFTLAFFKSANVSEETIARIYFGHTVPSDELDRVKRVLKERMTEDSPRVGTGQAGCPTCGMLHQEALKPQ
jgi:hypothetical protein